jgi:hypothetical protein
MNCVRALRGVSSLDGLFYPSRWISFTSTPCGAWTKAILVPGMKVTGSTVKWAPLLFSSAAAASRFLHCQADVFQAEMRRLGGLAVGYSRIGRRDEETGSAQFHRDTRLSGKRRASRIQTPGNLCAEHIFIELRDCFRIRTTEMDVVIFEDGHD